MISEKDLANVPSEHRATVLAEVEAARRDYVAVPMSSEQRVLWQRVAKLLKSAAVTELRQLASRIDFRNLPDPGFIDPISADRDWLPRMIKYLTTGVPVAVAYADLCKPRERLYSRLFRAWTAAGGELSVSETGPLVTFMQNVTDDLFARPISGEAIKKAVRREKARRRIGAAPARFEGQGGLIADGTVIKAE
jgi:hypothetical protein